MRGAAITTERVALARGNSLQLGDRNNNLLLPLLLNILYLSAAARTCGAFFIDERQSPAAQEWSYQRQQEWPQEHRQCNHKAQSPVDIQRKNVISNHQLKLRFFNYNQLTRFRIQNAHHTIKLEPILQSNDQFDMKEPGGQNESISDILSAYEDMDAVVLQQEKGAGGSRNKQNKSRVIVHSSSSGKPEPESSLEQEAGQQAAGNQEQLPYNGQPTIKLDWLDDGNNEYKLRDIHFHWGERRDNGSEHALDGRRAAMEMHLVHVRHGLDKSKIGFTSDAVTVIAVLIESYRKSNADFNPIVNALTRINMTNQAQEIEYKSIRDLLPNVLSSFYVYSGSLTTPPCYQVVNWVVMADRLYMNAKQLEMFRNLYAPVGHSHLHLAANVHFDDGEHEPREQQSEPFMIMPNIRHLQPLNNRTILSSFEPFGKLESMATGPDGVAGHIATSYYSSANSWQQQLDAPMLLLVVLVSFAMTLMPVVSPRWTAQAC